MTNERTGLSASGKLYVVATPIGNLGDLSARARDTLANCALIAAEDTRHTGILLKAFGIGTPQLSLHDHNEASRAIEIIARLREGKSVALVSDAGTPAISDPGFELVRQVAAAGLEIIAVPGPCAAIAALSIAALPTDRFCFEGFLPSRSAARLQRLKSLAHEVRTLVIYESPHRVRDTLEDCVAAFGEDRVAAIVREVTKLHETTYRGSLKELSVHAKSDPDLSRGEIVLIVGGMPPTPAADADAEMTAGLDKVLMVLLAELPLKQAAHLAARITGGRDNEAYKRALFLKQQSASH
ncbi:MAG TPA: 16S rRNA (cytidine(1402)-2'-O)-methyltransferase [Steroidobacteraceae bacterium]